MFFIDTNNLQPNKTLSYALPKTVALDADARNAFGLLAGAALLVFMFLTTVVFGFTSSNSIITLLLAGLTALSAFPFTISFAKASDIEAGVKHYDTAVNDLIKNAGQPLISADGTTIRFAYEFIDAENSTTDVLILKSDDEQVFMTPEQYADTSHHVDPALKQAIDHYIAHERLSKDEILERVQTVHTAAQHKESQRVLSFSEQFYKNTTQPIDTAYYRSLKTVHENVADDLKRLKTFQDDNIKENAEIIESLRKG